MREYTVNLGPIADADERFDRRMALVKALKREGVETTGEGCASTFEGKNLGCDLTIESDRERGVPELVRRLAKKAGLDVLEVLTPLTVGEFVDLAAEMEPHHDPDDPDEAGSLWARYGYDDVLLDFAEWYRARHPRGFANKSRHYPRGWIDLFEQYAAEPQGALRKLRTTGYVVNLKPVANAEQRFQQRTELAHALRAAGFEITGEGCDVEGSKFAGCDIGVRTDRADARSIVEKLARRAGIKILDIVEVPVRRPARSGRGTKETEGTTYAIPSRYAFATVVPPAGASCATCAHLAPGGEQCANPDYGRILEELVAKGELNRNEVGTPPDLPQPADRWCCSVWDIRPPKKK